MSLKAFQLMALTKKSFILNQALYSAEPVSALCINLLETQPIYVRRELLQEPMTVLRQKKSRIVFIAPANVVAKTQTATALTDFAAKKSLAKKPAQA